MRSAEVSYALNSFSANNPTAHHRWWYNDEITQVWRQSIATSTDGVDPRAVPSGTGCAECSAAGTWWFHLRRCAQCGHIGCCDSSPSGHATQHNAQTGHPIIASFEPGEDWFYDYRSTGFTEPQTLAEPRSHPTDQPAPGPRGKVPHNWQSLLR